MLFSGTKKSTPLTYAYLQQKALLQQKLKRSPNLVIAKKASCTPAAKGHTALWPHNLVLSGCKTCCSVAAKKHTAR